MQTSLVAHFVSAAHRALHYGNLPKNKARPIVLDAFRMEAMDAINNALCCRGLGRALRLEILSIKQQIVEEMKHDT